MTSGPTKNELPGHLSHAFPVLILSPYLSGSIDCEEHLLLILDSGKNDFESPKEPSCRWCRWRLHCKGAASSVHTAWEFLEFYDFIELFYCFNYQPRKIGMTKRNACCSYREPTIRQNSKWLYLFHRERERGRESFYWPASVNALGAVPAGSSEIETSIASSASSPASTSLTSNATQHAGLFIARAKQHQNYNSVASELLDHSFASQPLVFTSGIGTFTVACLNIWTLTGSIFSHWSCATLIWGNLQLLGALFWLFASQDPVFTVTDSPPCVVKHWSLVWDGCITSSVAVPVGTSKRKCFRTAAKLTPTACAVSWASASAGSSEIETSIASSASSPASTSLTSNATQHAGLFVARAKQHQNYNSVASELLDHSFASQPLVFTSGIACLNIWTLTGSIFSHWSCATLIWGNLQLLGALFWLFASQDPVFTVTDSPPCVVKHWSLVWDGCITSSVVQSSTHSSARGGPLKGSAFELLLSLHRPPVQSLGLLLQQGLQR